MIKIKYLIILLSIFLIIGVLFISKDTNCVTKKQLPIPKKPEINYLDMSKEEKNIAQQISIIPAWNISMGSESVVVGILDTGIDISHIDLKENIYINENEIPNNGIDDDDNGYVDDITGWDFVNNNNVVNDGGALTIHGTSVAGIIAACKNNKGIVGVAPKVKIMPLEFINGVTGYEEDAIEAIKYAQKMGVKIINCSWGDTAYSNEFKKVIAESGILFICAAGNDGKEDYNVYPASYNLNNVISVASSDNKGILDLTSNYGKNVHLSAPGISILSTYPGNEYNTQNGSSFSTAYVTGVAALILSQEPNYSCDAIAYILKNSIKTSESLKETVTSGGMIDAYRALNMKAPIFTRFNGIRILILFLISIILIKVIYTQFLKRRVEDYKH